MSQLPTDSSGKWVSVNDIRKVLNESFSLGWDHYSDLPSVSSYQDDEIKITEIDLKEINTKAVEGLDFSVYNINLGYKNK